MRVLFRVAPTVCGVLMLVLTPDTAAVGLLLLVIIINGALVLQTRMFKRFLGDIRADISDARAIISDIRADIGDARADLSALDEHVSRIEQRADISDARAIISDILARIDDARAIISDIRADIGDARDLLSVGVALTRRWSSRRALNRADARELARLRNEGKTWRELAEMFGVSEKTAKRTYDAETGGVTRKD
ncbi:hypothetical protein [Roseiflexus sp.]